MRHLIKVSVINGERKERQLLETCFVWPAVEIYSTYMRNPCLRAAVYELVVKQTTVIAWV